MARLRNGVLAMALCCRATNGATTVAVPTPAGMPTTAVVTTTVTFWDSSVSSGSGPSSGFLNPASLNGGSLASDFANSAGSSGSTASGSSGFFLQIWEWHLIAGLLFSTVAAIAACCCKGRKRSGNKNPRKKKDIPLQGLADPAPAAEQAQDSPLMPLATTSTAIPAWGMAGGMPMQYAAPYAQQGQQPGYVPTYSTGLSYAPPMAGSYAPPMAGSYAPPMAGSYGPPPMGGGYGAFPPPAAGLYPGTAPPPYGYPAAPMPAMQPMPAYLPYGQGPPAGFR